jgi:carboxypeptidase PM20D1
MRRVFGFLVVALVVFVAALTLSALRLPSRQLQVAPAPERPVDAELVAKHLAEAINFPTISYRDRSQMSAETFEAFQQFLVATYPRLHQTLELERVAGLSLLYTWRGSSPAEPPILLLAHQDVVPAENPERWTGPPFEARIADGYVWGRGAIDDKGSLIAICEAVEQLIKAGFVPKRTVLLAFGHDEEVGGAEGARKIAELLASRGVRALFAIDEGAAVVGSGMFPGLAAPVALVGVAEKGSATLEVVARAEGGHSSTPPRQTASGILARAIERLESNPLPGGVGGVTRNFFETIAPEMPLWARVPLANLWLFATPMDLALSQQPAVNALLRTTTAVTMLSGSPKENVLPVEAIATVNFRLLPGDSGDQLLERVVAIVDDPRVEVRFKFPPREASAVSPSDGEAYALIQRSIAEIFPGVVVAPFLTIGGTDAREYSPVTDGLYRFAPFVYGPADLKLAHGIDERIAVSNLPAAVRFYEQLVQNASAQ